MSDAVGAHNIAFVHEWLTEWGGWVRGQQAGDRPTGLFFREQTPASLVEAVEAFEQAGAAFAPEACRAWAEQFSEERFRREFTAGVEQAWALWQRNPRSVEALADGPGDPTKPGFATQ